MPSTCDVTLRKPLDEEAKSLYLLMTTDEKWTEYNGPYFGYSRPTYEKFLAGPFRRLKIGKDALAIDYQGQLIGTVTYYWEDEKTRWLEVGIVIFDSQLWGKGIAKQAIVPWVTHLFNTLEVERIGMSTWSGNPRMITSAQKIGFKIEGTLRKVRFYNGIYYDSIKLGVLREEWEYFK